VRIGLVVYGSLSTVSGGYLYDRQLVSYLVRRGHRVEVLDLPARAYGWRFSDNLSARARRFVLRQDLDVVLQDELCHPSLVLLNRYTAGARRPLQVAIVHHLFSREPRWRWLNQLAGGIERRYLAGMDAVICNSHPTRDTVRKWISRDTPLVVARPGGDHVAHLPGRSAIEHRARGSGPLQLVYLGSLIPRKGLLSLIQDVDGIDQSKWHLSVAGSQSADRRYVARIKDHIRQRGLGRQITLLGQCPDRALAAILADSHLLTMPYAYEGFGIALLEAMAFGLPVVASARGAAKEMIRAGENGYLVAPGQRWALGHIVETLYTDRRRLAHMSLAARGCFDRHPTWSQSMARIEGFLARLAGRLHHGNADDAKRSLYPLPFIQKKRG
jgi:glycosyltransferase involved in cell wall biosynthesis